MNSPLPRILEAKGAVDVESLVNRVSTHSAKVAVVGMGYVGLPLALALTETGFSVTGLDLDESKVQMLNAGQSYIKHIDSSKIADLRAQEAFAATSQEQVLNEADVILVCVPTPLTKQREPDMTYVCSTAEQIARNLRPGQLIVLESTTYPGTTVDVVKPILEAEGLSAGREFFLAYSPEREDPGNAEFCTGRIPKVVGGDGSDALRLAATLYEQIVPQVIQVSSPNVAEAVKLTENIFRSVNIALVNELKVIYDAMGIDVWEVIDAAKTKPFGFMPFYPGPGLGGHCIPIDPFYLTWKAREFDHSTRFIELAGEINTAMPQFVVERVAASLDKRFGKALSQSKILLIGLAYKKNVDDIRESASFRVMELLLDRGADVAYYDPYVPEIPLTREHPELAGRLSTKWDSDTLAEFDAAVILTDHDCIDYGEAVEFCRLIIDTRNATQDIPSSKGNVVKA